MVTDEIMIHTATGKILSVDYWALREILSEARRALQNARDTKRLDVCDTIINHLRDSHNV